MLTARRVVFAALVLLTAGGLLGAVAAAGWGVPLLVCFVPPALWFGVCVGNALPGFVLRLACRDPARAVLPTAFDDEAPIVARTAVIVTIRDEPLGGVLPSLAVLIGGLRARAVADRFAFWLLSDSTDADAIAAEEAAVAACDLPLAYRRRADNRGFKAGNVMEFLDHHAGDAELALVLDADSLMTADAALRLVRIMQAGPRLGIVQHLTAGRPAEAAFARLFQFGMRAGMRVWATGQAWWQGDEGPYWGHNAILRVAPFRTHARLPTLPGGRAILSHDQVEAALLRAAGWGVAVWADESGSLEANPPALPEFLARDARWLAGNAQYRHLLARPGLRAMGRWQLAQAMLMFAVAPALVAMLLLVVMIANAGGGGGPALALLAAGWLAAHSPKLLGYAEILLSAHRAARYGGRMRFALGAAAEVAFTTLLDPITAFHRTLVLAGLAFGRRASWRGQNRSARRVGWGEALRRFWPHTLAGVAVFALLAQASAAAALWAVPFAGGLPLAIPFAVATADPRLAGWLHRYHLTRTPEAATLAGGADGRACASSSPTH